MVFVKNDSFVEKLTEELAKSPAEQQVDYVRWPKLGLNLTQCECRARRSKLNVVAPNDPLFPAGCI